MMVLAILLLLMGISSGNIYICLSGCLLLLLIFYWLFIEKS